MSNELAACPYCESNEQVVHEHGQVVCYGCYDAETGGEDGGYRACGPMRTASDPEEWDELCADKAEDAARYHLRYAEQSRDHALRAISNWEDNKPGWRDAYTIDGLREALAEAEADIAARAMALAKVQAVAA